MKFWGKILSGNHEKRAKPKLGGCQSRKLHTQRVRGDTLNTHMCVQGEEGQKNWS